MQVAVLLPIPISAGIASSKIVLLRWSWNEEFCKEQNAKFRDPVRD
jgi:hypothetical protein